MPLYNRAEIVARALASTTNTVGTCQLWTRAIIGAPSAGDVDGDGDADAMDGWKSEPAKYKHVSDRQPPAGVPVAFSGGSKGYGHRAISLGNGKIRSTDMAPTAYAPGHVGTTTIGQIEDHMGVKYLGWSESMDGQLIPLPPAPARPVTPAAKPAPKPAPKPVRPPRVRAALNALRALRDARKDKASKKKAQAAIDQVKKDFPGSTK